MKLLKRISRFCLVILDLYLPIIVLLIMAFVPFLLGYLVFGLLTGDLRCGS